MKSVLKTAIFLSALAGSISAHALTLNLSCDNENDESIEGEVYFQVEGSLNLKKATSENLTLSMKQVGAESDYLLGEVKAEKIKHKSKKNKDTYSFKGVILEQEREVEITFYSNEITGLKYGISVDGEKLNWCAPLSFDKK